MQLNKQIGNFIQYSDIPENATVLSCLYGHLPLQVLDNIYTVCIADLKGLDTDVDNLSIDVEYSNTRQAMSHFSVFNIVDDIDLIVNNKDVAKPKEVTNLDSYIDRFANNHFKYCRKQLDCEYVLTAFNSELSVFASMLNFSEEVPYVSTVTFRTVAKASLGKLTNEIAGLRRIKLLFRDIHSRLSKIIRYITRMALIARTPRVANTELEL